MEQSKHHFDLKGKAGEEFVKELAEKTFFVDWCFPNPRLPNGKELCDLLVVFDQVVIIWQIKCLKLGDDGKYSESETDKNLRQLSGARRQLFELKTPIQLTNARRKFETFNPANISAVFLVSVLIGEGEDWFSFVEESKNFQVHVFTPDFLEIVLTELDTIADFADYLTAKEVSLGNKHLIIEGGEEELLAAYLSNDRSFESMNEVQDVRLKEGSWRNFQHSERYQSKKKADEISYGWDSIIDRAHEGSEKYEIIARELARPSRFERRVLAKTFLADHLKAHQDRVHDLHRSIFCTDVTTYCFLFCEEETDRSLRRKILECWCRVARGSFPQNQKVLGIATEQRIEPDCSYDFCLIDMPSWTSEDQRGAEVLKQRLGLLSNPSFQMIQEKEYPD